ncbi:dihydrodipicolinate synthase family protein [Microbacteriaceae bacterium VKM Ac-2855]|nr:dihydrodipicolinate synthase family protein [Microbacteriaceae bacterium VKM Ac-2855]
MSNPKPIKGIIAYPVTPFTEEGIDIDRLSALIHTLIDDGADAIAPLGSTGESAYLSLDEWKKVVDTTLDSVAGRVPVVVGASDLTTASTVERAVYADAAGADAVMILPISYWPLKNREILRHYRTVSDAIDSPIMVYNNPATAGIDLMPELLVEMFETIENVKLVKESTGDITRMTEITRLSGGALPFYNGSNPLVLDAFRAGATGWCTAAPCLLPGPVTALYRATREGDWEAATVLYEHLKPFLQFIVAQGLPGAIKTGLALQNRPAGDPRLPLLPLDDAAAAELATMLRQDFATL